MLCRTGHLSNIVLTHIRLPSFCPPSHVLEDMEDDTAAGRHAVAIPLHDHELDEIEKDLRGVVVARWMPSGARAQTMGKEREREREREGRGDEEREVRGGWEEGGEGGARAGTGKGRRGRCEGVRGEALPVTRNSTRARTTSAGKEERAEEAKGASGDG